MRFCLSPWKIWCYIYHHQKKSCKSNTSASNQVALPPSPPPPLRASPQPLLHFISPQLTSSERASIILTTQSREVLRGDTVEDGWAVDRGLPALLLLPPLQFAGLIKARVRHDKLRAEVQQKQTQSEALPARMHVARRILFVKIICQKTDTFMSTSWQHHPNLLWQFAHFDCAFLCRRHHRVAASVPMQRLKDSHKIFKRYSASMSRSYTTNFHFENTPPPLRSVALANFNFTQRSDQTAH